LITNCVTVKVLPSGSVSFDNIFPVAVASSNTATVSSTAVGASLTAVTVIANPAVAFPPLPSLTV